MKLSHGYILLFFLSTFSFAKENVNPVMPLIKETKAVQNQEALHLFFFNAGQGNFTLLKHKESALIIDEGNVGKNFSDIKTTFEESLGQANIKAIIVLNSSKESNYLLKTLRGNYCNDAAIVNILNQKIRVSHSKNHCEYLSLIDPNDLQQLASFLHGLFPNFTFQFPALLKQFNPTKIEYSSLTFTLDYEGTKLLFTGSVDMDSFNRFVDFKQKHTQSAKKQLVDNNTAILSNIKLFRIPALIKAQENAFQWISFLAKNSTSQSILVIENTANTISYPKDIKNKLQSINVSQGKLYLKIEKNSFFKYDFSSKNFYQLF